MSGELSDEQLTAAALVREREDSARLASEVQRLTEQLAACRTWQAKRVVAVSQDPVCIRWMRQSEQAEADCEQAERERDEARAQIAAVLAEHEPIGRGIPPTCPSCGVYAPCATASILAAAVPVEPQEAPK